MKILALMAAALLCAPAEGPKDLLVRAGTLVPGEGEPQSPGAVLCRGGKIVALGKDAEAGAAGAEVIDLGPRAVILPGLVAAASGLASPGAGVPESLAPEVRALDGFDFFKPQRRALEGGVTTVYLDAGRRRVIGGQGAVVKLAGATPESRTLRARAGLYGSVGDPARNPPALFDAPSSPDPVAHPLLPLRPQSPATRMAAVAMLREALAKGKGGTGALAAVAGGQEPLRLRADAAADIEASLALARDAGVRLVLAGGRDAGLLAEALAGSGASVVLESPLVPGAVDDPWDPEEAERRAAAMANPAVLAKRGVPFAIAARDEALGDLLLVAASHARHGLDRARAIRAVTIDAARILGVEDRVGSLAPGKDADLAVFGGGPFDARSTALLTVVDGVVAYRRDVSGITVIRAAAIHTGTGEIFAPGFLSIDQGKVVEVGPAVGVPVAARLIDRPDAVILPGFVDGHGRLGLRSPGGASGPLTTATPASKAMVPDDPSFAAALGAGITTALVAPGAGGTVVGTPSVVKTAGAERTLKEVAGIEVSLAGSGDLPAALQGLRDAIKGAQQYHEGWEKYDKDLKEYEKAKKEYEEAKKKRDEKKALEKKPEEKKPEEKKPEEKKVEEKKPEEPKKDEPKKDETKKEEPKKDEPKKEEPKGEPVEPKEPAKPGVNLGYEPWREVFRKKVPLLCRVSSAAETSGAVKVIKEESKLDLVLVGGDEAWRVAADLRKAEVGVLLGPRIVYQQDGKTVNGARGLAAAGVRFGFASDASAGARDLPLLAAFAVRHGLGPAAAVRALTLDGARLLGVADRVGSLEPGKDADFIVLTGDPFDAATRVQTVYVEGKVVAGAE